MRTSRPHGAFPDRRGVCRRVKRDLYVFEAAVPHASATRVHSLALRVTDRHVVLHNITQHNTTQASSRIRDTLGSNIADTKCVRHARVCRMHSYEVVPRRCLPEAAKSKEAVVARGDEECTHDVCEDLGVTMLRCASRCGANQNSYIPCNNQRGAMQSEPALMAAQGDGRHCAACQCWSSWPGSREAGRR